MTFINHNNGPESHIITFEQNTRAHATTTTTPADMRACARQAVSAWQPCRYIYDSDNTGGEEGAGGGGARRFAAACVYAYVPERSLLRAQCERVRVRAAPD